MSTGPIVVGIDGSALSTQALRWAKDTADLMGVELVAMTVWSPPKASFQMLVDRVPVDRTLDVGTETGIALERVVKEALGDAPVTLEVVEGDPGPAMVEASAGASMVVVANRGHGSLVGALLGSVSQHLAAHASCPVVIFRQATIAAR